MEAYITNDTTMNISHEYTVIIIIPFLIILLSKTVLIRLVHIALMLPMQTAGRVNVHVHHRWRTRFSSDGTTVDDVLRRGHATWELHE